MEIDKDIIICPYCGQVSKIVWVHGHGQCFICKSIIDECCRVEPETPQPKEEEEVVLNKKTKNTDDVYE